MKYLFGAKKSEIEIKGGKITSIVGSIDGDLDVGISSGVTKLSKRSLRTSPSIAFYDAEIVYEVGNIKGGIELGNTINFSLVA